MNSHSITPDSATNLQFNDSQSATSSPQKDDNDDSKSDGCFGVKTPKISLNNGNSNVEEMSGEESLSSDSRITVEITPPMDYTIEENSFGSILPRHSSFRNLFNHKSSCAATEQDSTSISSKEDGEDEREVKRLSLEPIAPLIDHQAVNKGADLLSRKVLPSIGKKVPSLTPEVSSKTEIDMASSRSGIEEDETSSPKTEEKNKSIRGIGRHNDAISIITTSEMSPGLFTKSKPEPSIQKPKTDALKDAQPAKLSCASDNDLTNINTNTNEEDTAVKKSNETCTRPVEIRAHMVTKEEEIPEDDDLTKVNSITNEEDTAMKKSNETCTRPVVVRAQMATKDDEIPEENDRSANCLCVVEKDLKIRLNSKFEEPTILTTNLKEVNSEEVDEPKPTLDDLWKMSKSSYKTAGSLSGERNVEVNIEEMNKELKSKVTELEEKLKSSKSVNCFIDSEMVDTFDFVKTKILKTQNMMISEEITDNSKDLEIKLLRSKITDLEHFIEKQKEENCECHKTIDDLKQSQEAYHFKEKEFDRVIAKLQEDIKDLKIDKEKAEQDLNNVDVNAMQEVMDIMKKDVQGKDLDLQKMAERIDVLQDEIKNADKRLEDTKQKATCEKETLENDIDSLKKEIAVLHESAAQNKKDVRTHDNNVAVIPLKEDALSSLNEQLDEELLGKIEMYDAMFLQIASDKNAKLPDNDHTEGESTFALQIDNAMKFLESSNALLRNKLREVTQEKEKIYEKEKRLQQYNKQLEGIVVSSRNTVNELKQTIAHLGDAQKKWNQKEQNLQSEIKSSDRKISALESKLSEQTKALENVQVPDKRVKTSQETSENSTIDQSRLAEITTEMASLQNKLKTKEEFMKELQQRVAALANEKSNVLKQLKQKSVKVAKLESTLKLKSEVEKNLTEKVQALDTSVKDMTQRLENLTAEKEKLTEQLETKQVSQECKKSNDSSEVRNRDLELNTEEYMNEKRQWCDQEKKLKDTITQLEEASKTVKSENEALSKQLKRCRELSETSMKSLEEKLEQTIKTTHNLYKREDKLKTCVKSLEDNKVSSKDKVKELEHIVFKMENSKAKLEQKETKLENEAMLCHEKINDLQEKLAERKEIEEGFDKQKNYLKETIEELKERIEISIADKKTLEIQCQQMKASMECKTEELKKSISKQKKAEVNLHEQEKAMQKKIDEVQNNLRMFKIDNERLNTIQKEIKETSERKVMELESKISVQNIETEKRWHTQQRENEEINHQLHECIRLLTIENENLNSKHREELETSETRLFELEKKCSEEYVMAAKTWHKQERQLEEKIDELQKRISKLSNENEKLNLLLKYKEQIEFSEKKVVDLEKKSSDGHMMAERTWRQQEQQMQDRITELHDRICALEREKERLTCKYKEQIETSEKKLFELKQRNSEQRTDVNRKLREQEKEMEEKIQQLEKRIRELTMDKEKLHQESKEQLETSERKEQKMSKEQMIAEKKWSDDMTYMENRIATLNEREHKLSLENEDLATQLKETTTSYESEITDLKQQLKERKDSERKLSSTVEYMDIKISDLNDKQFKLEKEKESLFNRLRENKAHMRKDEDLKEKLSKKVTVMHNEISKLKAEKIEFDRLIAHVVKELQSEDGLTAEPDKDKSKLDTREEIDFALEMVSNEQINETKDETSTASHRTEKIESWRTLKRNFGGDPQEELQLDVMDEEYFHKTSVHLRSSLNTLKTSVLATLRRALDQEKKAHEMEMKLKKQFQKVKETLKRLKEENESLRAELGASNAHLQNTIKEAEVTHTRWLECEEELTTLMESMKQKIAKLETEKITAESQLKKLEKLINELQKDIKLKEINEKQLKDKIAQLDFEKQECAKDAKQNDTENHEMVIQLKTQIRELKSNLKAKQIIEKDLTYDVQQLEKELEIESKRTVEYHKVEKELQKQVKDAAVKISELTKSKTEADQAIDEIVAEKEDMEQVMRRKMDNQTQEKNRIIASKDELQRAIDILTSQMHNFEREKEGMERENSVFVKHLEEDLEREKTRATKCEYELEREKRKRKIKELDKTMIAKRSEENEKLNDEIMKLNESLSKVTGDLERQTKTNRELKDKLNNKETTIACLTCRKEKTLGERISNTKRM